MRVKVFHDCDAAISYAFDRPWDVVYSFDDDNFWCAVPCFRPGFSSDVFIKLHHRKCTSDPGSSDFYSEANNFFKCLEEDFNNA